jgi:hypothetical protein
MNNVNKLNDTNRSSIGYVAHSNSSTQNTNNTQNLSRSVNNQITTNHINQNQNSNIQENLSSEFYSELTSNTSNRQIVPRSVNNQIKSNNKRKHLVEEIKEEEISSILNQHSELLSGTEIKGLKIKYNANSLSQFKQNIIDHQNVNSSITNDTSELNHQTNLAKEILGVVEEHKINNDENLAAVNQLGANLENIQQNRNVVNNHNYLYHIYNYMYNNPGYTSMYILSATFILCTSFTL